MIISVIGLGYIGLPTAAVLASNGLTVIGVDVNQNAVDIINQGKIYTVEPELDILVQTTVQSGFLKATTKPVKASVFMIAVPTPFIGDYEPDLSYIESALLAALPRAPSKYNPYKSKKKAKARRNIVLKNLYENSYINKKEYEKFIKNKYKISVKKDVVYKNEKIFIGKYNFKFNDIIQEAYLNRISLSSNGFYSTPKINFNKKKFYGRPFLYFCYGAAVTEVTIDTLTGENIIDTVDILQDAGNAINPALELGQIEGGFVQGQGWLTMEEVNWKANGQITTFSPSTYKIPAVSDIPKKFKVEIYKEGKNKEEVVNKAKTTGEPPLMLAMSVFFAIKDAIASTSNYKKIPHLDAPATPEKILLSISRLINN